MITAGTKAAAPASSTMCKEPGARYRPRSSRVVRHALLAFLGAGLATYSGQLEAAPKTPNILFIVMDDVGIDQMRVMGYGGETPPATPNIDTIANSGMRFHNTWSMPACSTSRAVFFTGRYPFRTDVYGALGPDDLANPWSRHSR